MAKLLPGDYSFKLIRTERVYAEAFPFPPILICIVSYYRIPFREEEFEVVTYI
jgi:hypothetical protein